MKPYDFANILFGGPCNLRCPDCIGRQLDPALTPDNLDEFPPRNLDVFIALLKQHGVTQVVFTGANTDPQLYRHEDRLLDWLRERLPETRCSLHTNGLLALRKIETFNRYDRVTLSFPSFDPAIYQKMTGSARMPDLSRILQQARVPVKISCVVNQHNARHISEFLRRCQGLNIKRVVFRPVYYPGSIPGSSSRHLDCLLGLPGLVQKTAYRGNPMYEYGGMQITWWDFSQSTSASLNLFSNGHISPDYLLVKASHVQRKLARAPASSRTVTRQ